MYRMVTLTLRFLTEFYLTHKALEKKVKEMLNKIPEIMKEALLEAMGTVAKNIFTIAKDVST